MIRTMCTIILCAAVFGGRQSDMESFEKVWTIINEKHWDLEGTGVDWQAVYQEYKPKAEKSKNIDEMRGIITNMISELGQTHFGLLGGDQFAQLESLQSELMTGSGHPGFDVDVVDGRCFVTRVYPREEETEIPYGSELLRIRGKSAGKLIKAVEKAFAKSAQKGLYTKRLMNELLTGPTGSDFEVDFRPPNQKEVRSVRRSWRKRPGSSHSFGNLEAAHLFFESRMLDDNVGYVHFNIFLLPVMAQFEKAINQFVDADGLIIDLRGNGGGIGFMASGLAGYFIKEKGKKLGTMYTKGSSHLNFIVVPRRNQFDKPLAFLIDQGSASTSEIFACGMSDLGRARLFGSRSAGAALPSFIDTLPNGDRFQYAFANYISDNGLEIEGHGVAPDQPCPHRPELLLQGRDDALQQAITWIKKH